MQVIKSYYWLVVLVAMIVATLGFTIWMQSAHH